MVGTWFGGFKLLISENQTKMRFDFLKMWNWFKNWKHSFWWMEGWGEQTWNYIPGYILVWNWNQN